MRAIVLLAAVAAVLAVPTTKIESRLQETLATKGTANILITMKESTDAALATFKHTTFSTHGARTSAVAESLMKHAAQSQKSVLSLLDSQKSAVDYEVFWISNQIYIRNANAELVSQIAEIPNVQEVSEEFWIHLDPVIPGTERKRDAEILAEWGVEKVEAPACWAAGHDGTGAIVGGIDTGVFATHQDLSGNFVGTNYGWRDVTIVGSQQPRDGNGHGTHTMGTIVGANGIGVAPGAKWMACKGLTDQGSGTNAGLISCGQFMACPTLPNGQSPDCTKAPHVVSNSWGGGQANSFYNTVINSWHAAGIIPVFANGNSGPACQTANSPADSLAGVLGVGATSDNNAIASFSSKGPTVGGRQKPDIAAPGQNVRSAWYTSTSAYNTISGTSMACPHVAGVVALLKARTPTAQFAAIKSQVESTASHTVTSSGTTCGGVAETTFPNMAFGHGIVNAKNALGL